MMLGHSTSHQSQRALMLSNEFMPKLVLGVVDVRLGDIGFVMFMISR